MFALLFAGAAIPVGLAGAAVNPEVPLRVTASDGGQVHLAVGPLAVRWRSEEIPGDAGRYYDLVVPGFSNLGDPGAPRTPRQGGWVLVPPGMRPELEVISEEWADAGGRVLLPAAVPVILPGSDDGGRFVSEIRIAPGQPLPGGVDIPPLAREAFAKRGQKARTRAVSLGDVTWWRGRQVVPVLLVPVLHDGLGRADRVLVGGEWRIRFVPRDKSSGPSDPGPAREDGRGDDRFSGAFLNANLLDATLPESATAPGGKAIALPGVVHKQATLLAPEARLAVKTTRLQRVTATRLRERGLLPDTPLAEDAIRLYQRRYLGPTGAGDFTEIEVPILMVGDGGNFEGDDFFVFYGLRLLDDTAYTADLGDGTVDVPGCGDNYEMNNEANLYWLAAAEPAPGESWARMGSVEMPAAATTPLSTYRRSERHEKQVAFREHNYSPGDDRVYQNDFSDAEATATIDPLWSPALGGQDATIQVGYTGFSTRPGRLLRFDLLVDNFPTAALGTQIYLATMSEQTRIFSVAAGLLAGNRAEVVMTRDEAESALYAYFNWMRIEYDAYYRALNNELRFNSGGGGGTRPIEVTGFTGSDLGLVDITDPRRPVAVNLQSANIQADGQTWTLSIAPSQVSAPREFVARGDWHGGGIPEFSYISSSLAADPEDPRVLTGPEPDLLVVTHADFRDAIGRWVEHRKARAGGDLTVKVVDVQDLYDHYSGGLHDAWAIKRFAAEAVARWGSWALMLVGDANENVRGFKVPSDAQGWATDFVPAHYHVQRALDYNPELMATDKWYATSEAGMTYPQDNFPVQVRTPWEMYVGRFPCNNVAELNTMIDKVILVESPAAGQPWRRRGIFFGDDSWSNGYGLDALSKLTYRSSIEDVFADSTRTAARYWSRGTPVTLEADTLFLAKWLEPLWPQGASEDRSISEFAGYAEQYALPPLLQALNTGGLVCYYQGHANQYVLCSEYWIQDELGTTFRKDVASMNNATAPWFFLGLGCHISDWAQDTVSLGSRPKERSLSEKMMIRSGGGASGTYGSSGYEFIDSNAVFTEVIFRRWMFNPPTFDGLTGNTQALPGSARAPRSRWMIGELLWAGEADMQVLRGTNSIYQQMISQFTLLGDPLMILDAGEPEVSAAFDDEPGTPLSGEIVLKDTDGSNHRQLNVVAKDEAGIDRLQLVDSRGTDLTASNVAETLPDGESDHQEVHFATDIPIRPFAHTLSVQVFDTGASLATDRHWQLDLTVPMEAEITSGGGPVDPAEFVFIPEVPVEFSLDIASGASLTGDETITVDSADLALSGIAVTRSDAHNLRVTFTAEVVDGVEDVRRQVDLVIDDGTGTYRTTYELQSGSGGGVGMALGRVFNFPNPMADATRFVIESATGGQGVIRVFAVSGRVVASIPFTFGGGGEAGIVPWDARDGRGDELANGTYLYRVEMDSPGGKIAGDIQRLVVMR